MSIFGEATRNRQRREMMIAVIAKLTAKPGHEDELGAALTDGAAKVLAGEPGCLLYRVARSRSDTGVYTLMEIYASQAALDAHPNAPHFEEIRTALSAHLGAAPEVEFLDALN
ncbi:antibiotic biosynthesis monooxygenase [Sphingopyxis lindanitolerans]|uniref:Antibiotic biosynthesis monooxygenase n=2 Tax=Sphingopyxis lindanitolerans TaxID=2054227 RepID=A0A2S8B5T8_9SPHN|nr:antibiotic biosynthesis monooxygenase [Sphingopyxis lindanitolerans]